MNKAAVNFNKKAFSLLAVSHKCMPNKFFQDATYKYVQKQQAGLKVVKGNNITKIMILSNFNSFSTSSYNRYNHTRISRDVYRNNYRFSITPYLKLARVDKPIGTYLLFFPCIWSITMCAYANDTINLIDYGSTAALFFVGAFLLRGAGCTVNDLWDRDLDKLVERTKNRPLASGELTPKQALRFLAVQLSGGLVILSHFDFKSILLGASSLVLVTLYPLMKRVTYWPQFVLGLTFNWGCFLGWSCLACGDVDLMVCLPLYISGIFWTLFYDTIYAFQDKIYDIKAGIKSTALYVEGNTKYYLTAFAVAQTSFLIASGYFNHQGILFYVISCFGSSLHLTNQILTLRENDPKNCLNIFKSNAILGAIVFCGIALDLLYKKMFCKIELDKKIKWSDEQ
ncbi:Para-hydroxybenzoate--polyprenyltransferase, mitochondrial precursor (PHB:polyprenyltransferase) [Lobulomyces angularis]|nr:Para-hydroxybenzoate--polyprenyltransferase, mitochondrial precursor (PHB:polyprenyltransferase) [Lobulomyces angularis]